MILTLSRKVDKDPKMEFVASAINTSHELLSWRSTSLRESSHCSLTMGEPSNKNCKSAVLENRRLLFCSSSKAESYNKYERWTLNRLYRLLMEKCTAKHINVYLLSIYKYYQHILEHTSLAHSGKYVIKLPLLPRVPPTLIICHKLMIASKLLSSKQY